MKTYRVTVDPPSKDISSDGISDNQSSSKFGLKLSQLTNGSSQVLIKEIAPKSVFSVSSVFSSSTTDILQPGLQLLEINHQPISSVQQAIQILLKHQNDGKAVAFVAKGQVATVNKASKDMKVGISIQRKNTKEMTIQKIATDGLFSNTGLLAGQRITMINGNECPTTSREAIAVIRETVGELTIVTVPSSEELMITSLSTFLEDHQFDATTKNESLSTTAAASASASATAIIPELKRENSEVTVPLGSFLEDHHISNGLEELDSLRPVVPDNTTILANKEQDDPVVMDSEYGTTTTNIQEEVTKPDHVTAILSKSYPGEKIGLSLRNGVNKQQQQQVLINQIVDGKLADILNVPLRIGQTVLSINDDNTQLLSAKRATEQIAEAPRTVTIVVTNTVATAFKAAVDTKVGLALKSSRTKPNGGVFIQDVMSGGLFSNSNLREGQEVVAINGKDCPYSAREATQILRACVGLVTIVVGDRGIRAKQEQSTANQQPQQDVADHPKSPVVAQQQHQQGTKSVISKEEGKWVGISFAKSTNGVIIVRKIADDSPLKDSDLKVGQKIVAVNGEECPKSITDLISLIYRSSGPTTLVSADIDQKVRFVPTPTKHAKSAATTVSRSKHSRTIKSGLLLPGQVRAQAIKMRKDQPVGMKVIRSFQDRVVISTIKENGPLANSDLRVGQFIVSINGTPCPLTKGETIKFIKGIVGPVTIVASRSIGTGNKPKVSTPVGISLHKQNGQVVIMKLSKNCILRGSRQSSLREGQCIVSINGNPCPRTVKVSIAVIKETVGRLTIEAVDRFKSTTDKAPKETAPLHANQPVLAEPKPVPAFKEITVTVANKKSSDMLGLSLGATQNYAFVNHIAADSPFVSTDLCVGHRIFGINGEPCPLPLQDALDLFVQHVGSLSINALEKVVSVGQVSASMVKESQQTPPGFEVAKSTQDRWVVSKIDEEGPFAISSLQVGQVLLSVNGRQCTSDKSMQKIFGAVTGKVTIVAAPTISTAFKENIDQKAGIHLVQKGKGSDISVQALTKDGLLYGGDLQEGQKIVSIAGVPCPRNLREAVGLIQDCVGELKIVAVDTLPSMIGAEKAVVPVQMSNGGAKLVFGKITVSVVKESKQSRIGMKLRKGMQMGRVVISTINEDGLMAGKGLKVGMWIVAINGEPCPSDPKWATEKIKGLVGSVTVVASPTIVTVSKKAKDAKIGLGLAKKPTSAIFVHHIAKGSVFENTDLQVGQNVLAINAKSCDSSLQDTIKSVSECVGDLTIVALDRIVMKESQ